VASVNQDNTRNVDVEAAARLVAALEQDLKKLSGSSADIQRLRDEVATLKNVLESPVQRSHWIAEGLHGVRDVFERVREEVVADGVKGGQYLAEIGRILGL
jgi:hypothetical protein